jgi:hypothetical protein
VAALKDPRNSGAMTGRSFFSRLPAWLPWAIATIATGVAIYFAARRG